MRAGRLRYCHEALVTGRLEHRLWPDVEFRPWAAAKAQLDPSLTDRGQVASPVPWVQTAAAITRPTLVVTGGRQEAVLVTASSRQQLADLGNRYLEVEVVPGARQTVRRDYADAHHQIVDPRLRRQFAGAGS